MKFLRSTLLRVLSPLQGLTNYFISVRFKEKCTKAFVKVKV